MKYTVASPRSLRGELRVPGDKSISHRAAIFNAVATGSARIEGFLAGADCLNTLECLGALGVLIERQPSPDRRALTLIVHGRDRLGEADDVLDAGNSGTTMRLLAGLLAGQPIFTVLTGDASLRKRPMARVVEPLRRMGASITGRDGGTRAPLSIVGGNLLPIHHTLPVASAQVKSALLLAGLQADGETRLTEPARSRDHSERMLRAMGADILVDDTTVRVIGPGTLSCTSVCVPGDVSSTAFWLVAATIHPDADLTIRDTGVNPSRTGLIDVLMSMGARITVENEREVAGEPVADVTVRSAELQAVGVGGEMIPRLIDEIPALAVAAAFARGTTVIRDAAELRVKESDRIATLTAELRRLGVRVEERPDGLVIEGGYPLQGAQCHSHGDHRLAMALAVAGLAVDGETTVEEAEAVEVSYPGFWDDLTSLLS